MQAPAREVPARLRIRPSKTAALDPATPCRWRCSRPRCCCAAGIERRLATNPARQRGPGLSRGHPGSIVRQRQNTARRRKESKMSRTLGLIVLVSALGTVSAAAQQADLPYGDLVAA